MRPFILSATTVLFFALTNLLPAASQSQNINCVREGNVINCHNYGSFRYQSNNGNRNNCRPVNINCFRSHNVINCPNYGSFEYSNNNNWSNNRRNLDGEINNLFLQVLGRNATANELRDFSQTVNNRGWSLGQVRENLVNSENFYQSVNGFYREFLGRNLDNNGLISYRNAVINGRNLADIQNEIRNSTEARNRNYNNDYNYNGVNYNSQWQRQLNDLYIQVLGRNATANDLRNYNQSVNNQNYSLDQARRDLINSQDFKQALNEVYQEYLGRNADSQGLQSYRNVATGGSSFENIRNEIANSAEADRYYNNNNDDYYYNQSGENSLIEGVLCQLTGLCF